MNRFIIPFSGLGLGEHEFSFAIEDAFFQSFENANLQKVRGVCNIKLSKHTVMLVLEFHIKAEVEQSCDRCLVEAYIPIEGDFKLIVKFGEEQITEDDDILVLPHGQSEINVAQYIYEFTSLLLPLQKVLCEITGDKSLCDEEMLAKINEHSTQQGGDDKNDDIDPRWQQLKNIKLN